VRTIAIDEGHGSSFSLYINNALAQRHCILSNLMNHASNAVDFVALSGLSVLAGVFAAGRAVKAKELYSASLEDPDREVGWDPDVIQPNAGESKVNTRVRTQAHIEAAAFFAAGLVSAGCGAEALSIVGDYL
jgi:hypothetical protein